ncbi:SHOCT domain-containing protein [Robertmurraya yapensis]|uniref:SHOCT domain-containing protein n=1 Tax=Bacillus yapensis TaxID=2492960 RepID=A0A431VY51_9BACI|nr:SHOCT domain-containing protein [Bacillus yapensis]RTR28171.1 SHOCT domain-containing protein [Bacillus yapensis]TKS94415.1 SHOCT domain-containing protein [Bacillus yapensis]
MLNVTFSIIIFYFLVKTGDLFKLIKIAKKLILDFIIVFKKEKHNNKGYNNPLEVLKLRYARGDIDKGEYEQIVKNL